MQRWQLWLITMMADYDYKAGLDEREQQMRNQQLAFSAAMLRVLFSIALLISLWSDSQMQTHLAWPVSLTTMFLWFTASLPSIFNRRVYQRQGFTQTIEVADDQEYQHVVHTAVLRCALVVPADIIALLLGLMAFSNGAAAELVTACATVSLLFHLGTVPSVIIRLKVVA
ncbi:hypothetical protein [Lactiplantibacillus fabifermentans]|uniref:Uncharacterized protein n=2 Tax=Lactiplantibacillus fabifermentans TaxID=483011 RepID=A0A0R2NTG8_9LACO|nr:hypothetical protein [Lactiplantibacillus fabifermentans]ETY74004.1 hypothetical protein LFAB_09475 [Lactiplantibacillus fabifermentans T30PCM01]KRO27357.1 hypothetical protein DY78_GL000107 [Lactiplantibacillus fabifermentans DSM 21115]